MAVSSVKDLFDLSGKVAIITGGARTLGYDMALALAEMGADVAVTSRKIEDAEKSAREIARLTGRKALGVACDVRYEEQVQSAVDAVLKNLGKIDVLVNNAGNVVSTPQNKPIEQRPTEQWDFTLDVNLKGVFLCTRYVVAQAMKPAHSGVISMTREMACWLAQYNIRVNCISPGGFWRGHTETFTRQYSNLVPMGRMGEDGKEIKGAVVFLASEASSYVTGINLVVDGGMSAW